MLKIYNATSRENDWTVHAIYTVAICLENRFEKEVCTGRRKKHCCRMWKEYDVQ